MWPHFGLVLNRLVISAPKGVTCDVTAEELRSLQSCRKRNVGKASGSENISVKSILQLLFFFSHCSLGVSRFTAYQCIKSEETTV